MTESTTQPAAPLPEQSKPPVVTGAYQTDAQKKAEADKILPQLDVVKV